MSRYKSLFSVFTKSNSDTKISIKQLYTIYLILCKYNHLSGFNQFYLYFYLFRHLFRNTYSIYLFLLCVFFSKTKQIKFLSGVDLIGITTTNNSTIVSNNNNHTLFDFWGRVKKLKRPITDLHYSDYAVHSYKSKINKYVLSGFLVMLDSTYFVRVKSEAFLRDMVQINKPLLTTPKYSSSSINKYLSLNSIQGFEFQFLRKNKVYNKGRYSRCRQNYRTGVYMCMYLSVVSIFGLYYWFYKFSFNFTYLWWLFISFVASFFVPKVIKYRLYEPTTLVSKFLSLFKWFSLLVKSFLK